MTIRFEQFEDGYFGREGVLWRREQTEYTENEEYMKRESVIE